MNILMIRHPVTKANIAGIVPQNIEGEIAEEGYEQMRKLLVRMNSESIDAVYSSDSDRCKVLAEHIASLNGIRPIYSTLFRELNSGKLAGRNKKELARLMFDNSSYAKFVEGESLSEFSLRAKEGLEFIVRGCTERSVLISHGWYLKVFVGLQLGMQSLQAIKSLKFSNCALSEIRVDKGDCFVEYLNMRDYLR